MIELRSERFLLRPWRKSDLPALVRHANNKKIADQLRDGFPYPYTEADGRSFLKMAMRSKPINVFAIEIDGEAVGSIGFFAQGDVHRLNAEIGYWLAEIHWGKGIMSEVIQVFADYVFANYSLVRLYAQVLGNNVASHRVLEKAGFVREAVFKKAIIKNGRLHDEVVYALLRPDYYYFEK